MTGSASGQPRTSGPYDDKKEYDLLIPPQKRIHFTKTQVYNADDNKIRRTSGGTLPDSLMIGETPKNQQSEFSFAAGGMLYGNDNTERSMEPGQVWNRWNLFARYTGRHLLFRADTWLMIAFQNITALKTQYFEGTSWL